MVSVELLFLFDKASFCQTEADRVSWIDALVSVGARDDPNSAMSPESLLDLPDASPGVRRASSVKVSSSGLPPMPPVEIAPLVISPPKKSMVFPMVMPPRIEAMPESPLLSKSDGVLAGILLDGDLTLLGSLMTICDSLDRSTSEQLTQVPHFRRALVECRCRRWLCSSNRTRGPCRCCEQ